MKTPAFTLALAAIPVAISAPAMAAPDARFLRALDKLDPKTRLEQICDLEAMRKMSASNPPGRSRVDRAKSDVITPPQHLGHMLVAKGGAFRAGGKWYQMSFTCKATPDHKSVLDFSYRTGAEIPAAKWASYGLWK